MSQQIVWQCLEVGLVKGTDLSVDGTFLEANAAKESRIPRAQLAEAAQVHNNMRQYLVELEQQNPVEEPAHEQDQVSTTDPDSTVVHRPRWVITILIWFAFSIEVQLCSLTAGSCGSFECNSVMCPYISLFWLSTRLLQRLNVERLAAAQ